MRKDKQAPTSSGIRLPGAAGRFMRLYDLSDYKVAHGDPDIQGWDVKSADGITVGRVDNLIVDTEIMQVRYLDVELDRRTFDLQDERHVLAPVAIVRLDDDHDDVLFDTLTAAEVASLQRYYPGQRINPDPAPPHCQADTQRFYGNRGGTGAVVCTAQGQGDDVAADQRQADDPSRRDPDRPIG